MKILYKDIGRNKRSWEETCAYADLDKIARSAKKKGGLMSRSVEAAYDETDKLQATKGTIFVGMFRAVGTFELIEP